MVIKISTELNKLEIDLKQHTPLIHFQHNKNCSTIRMTEFKPKLDKFLLKQNFDHEKYLMKNSEDIESFDYSVRVKDIKKNEMKSISDDFPLFFGNLGVDNNIQKKKFIICSSVTLLFASFYKELLEEIIKILPIFLMQTNFGTRQSKGFGSFFINDNYVYKLNNKKNNYSSTYICQSKQLDYSFTVKAKGSDKFNRINSVFEEINKLYSAIKNKFTGKKENKIYPYIRRYAQYRRKNWEKECIKKELYDIGNLPYNSTLIKNMIGLSTSQKWYKPKNDIIDKEHTNNEIDRIPSPIFFKILQIDDNKYQVFIKLEKLPDEIFGQAFNIKIREKNKKFKLNIPQKDVLTIKEKDLKLIPQEYSINIEEDDNIMKMVFEYILQFQEYPRSVKYIIEQIKENKKGVISNYE